LNWTTTSARLIQTALAGKTSYLHDVMLRKNQGNCQQHRRSHGDAQGAYVAAGPSDECVQYVDSHPTGRQMCKPEMYAEFRRLGDGRISVISIDDPQAWGLPERAKQKVVWLCDECSSLLDIRVDHGSYLVHIIKKPRTWERRTA
jgi:hypothetical protein